MVLGGLFETGLTNSSLESKLRVLISNTCSIKFSVASFTDKSNQYGAGLGVVKQLLATAQTELGSIIAGNSVTIDLSVTVDQALPAYATGGGAFPSYYANGSTVTLSNIIQQKIIRGVDANGTAPDGSLMLSTG